MTLTVTASDNLNSGFARVEASHGMSGVDGVTIKEFGQNLDLNLRLLAAEIEERRYRPLPLLKFLVAKRDGSPRPLTVPAVRDRVAQAAVLNVIEPLFEREFEDASYAYRKGRSVRSAACRIRDLREQGYCYVLECDVDSCFDSIDHDLLFPRVEDLVQDEGILSLIRMWVKAEIYDGKSVFIMERGIPQGSVISPSLANLFLDDFDEAMLAQGHKLVRYADDFIVLTKNRSQAEAALELTEHVLSELQLELDEEDTQRAVPTRTEILTEEGLAIIAMQTEALMIDAYECTTIQDIRSLYEDYWCHATMDSCEQVRFFARQLFYGGYFGMVHPFHARGKYYPYLMTAAGSVFVLRAKKGKEETAEMALKNLRMQGLPLSKSMLSKLKERGISEENHWQQCPFVPQNGFGEICLNLDWHWNN